MNDSYIYNWLKQMENESDREILKTVSAAFQEVIAYNKKSLKDISDRIEKELWMKEEPFIRCSAVRQKDIPLLEGDFYPVAEIMTDPYLLGVLFFETDRAGITYCQSKAFRIVFKNEGEIVGEGNVRFYPCFEFRAQAEQLEQSMYENEVFCTGLNLAYFSKFLKMVWDNGQETQPPLFYDDAEIEEIKEKFIYRSDAVPVWNVRTISLRCTIFPVPAGENGFFEHRLNVPQKEDFYLVKPDKPFESVFYRDDRLIVRSDTESAEKWNLYQIMSGREKEIYVPHYPLISNERSLSNGDRLSERAVRPAATKAEIFRIFQNRKAAENFELLNILWEESCQGCIKPYRNKEQVIGQKVLNLQIRRRIPGFIDEEQLSYLLGVLQGVYPEYVFAGEFV